MSAVRCPRHCCGLLMTPVTDGMGRVGFVCAGCERNRRGLCRDCPRPRANTRALRCAACADQRRKGLQRERDRERYPRRRKAVLAHLRKRSAIPEIREHRRQYMKAYRAANPRDANDRAYQRAYMAARRADPAYRARQNAKRRELRARERQEARAFRERRRAA